MMRMTFYDRQFPEPYRIGKANKAINQQKHV